VLLSVKQPNRQQHETKAAQLLKQKKFEQEVKRAQEDSRKSFELDQETKRMKENLKQLQETTEKLNKLNITP
jgi:hypothetical protein